jgi:hypothetical protein
MAIAASLVGAWIGARLGSETIPHSPTLRWAALASAIVVAGLLAFPLNTTGTSDVSASVQLRDVHGGAQRTVAATVTMNPRDGADGANWLTATAWQGGGRIVDKLREVRPGVFRSNVPLPVYGEWKTMIRMHKGNAVLGLPIYAPQDKAIPVPAIRAPASFTRPFFSDKELLQREARIADPAVTYAAYGVVVGFTLLLLAAIAWALHRVGRTAGQRREPPPPPPATPQPETGGGGEPQPDDAWPARIPVAGISSYTGGR